jgi:membrane protease YdiL (CAAX protease family)
VSDQPPDFSHQPPGNTPAATRAARIVALIEVLICSDYPTQLALGGTLTAFGYGPFAAHGRLSLTYVVGLSLADTLVLVGLVLLFLYAHGERPRDVLFGGRPLDQEAAAGVMLIPIALGIAIAVLLVSQRLAPWLHTVAQNPLQDLMQSPRDAWLFAVVLVVAGGIREEVQRAFLLHRFEVWLGGGTFGVIVTSIGFGLGHLLQGADAALATGLLGALWGAVYLRRRSAVAPIVSHAGFDLAQVVQFLVARRS